MAEQEVLNGDFLKDDYVPTYKPLNAMRNQSQLGTKLERVHKEGLNVVRMSLARVLKVNYKYNTVDLVTVIYKNTSVKDPVDNGKFSARLPIRFGGKTPEGNVFGATTLVTIGSLVLVGYLEGDKDSPIVLSSYGETEYQSLLTRTTYTSGDESDERLQREFWQDFVLYPSMTYSNTDGKGNKEMTFAGQSFMYITQSDPINEYVQDWDFRYIDLPNSRYSNRSFIEPVSPQCPTFLYVHQGVHTKHRLTVFFKSDGTYRVANRHIQREGVTYHQMDTDGTMSLIQQRDESNPELIEYAKEVSRIDIRENGSIALHQKRKKEKEDEEDEEPVLGKGYTSDIEIDVEGNIKLSAFGHSLEINPSGVFACGRKLCIHEDVTSLAKMSLSEPLKIEQQFTRELSVQPTEISTHLVEFDEEFPHDNIHITYNIQGAKGLNYITSIGAISEKGFSLYVRGLGYENVNETITINVTATLK